MSNVRENPLTSERSTIQQFPDDETSHFRRRILSNGRFLCPRRYVMAFLLSILLAIEVVRHWNTTFTIIYAILSDQTRKEAEFPSIGNWTVKEMETLATFMLVGDMVMNIVGCLLIHQFSSHKFLLVSVTAFSILHALMPTALNYHSDAFLLCVMIGQEVLSAPIFIAVLSIWKDWAPAEERTRLVTISLCGIGLEAVSTILFFAFSPTDFKSISYFVGISGVVWALFWYNTTSSIPQSDPLMTEKEYLYLESKIPSNYQEKSSLRDVPWKCIGTSKQVAMLCLILGKLGCSIEALQINGLIYIIYMTDKINPMLIFIPFIVVFIFVFIGSSFLLDFLVQKYSNKSLMIRKYFLSSGFVLQSLFLFISISPLPDYVRVWFYTFAYCCFAFSIPGILRLPLDLSPRYVSLLAGIGFVSYNFGTLSFQEFADHTFDPHAAQPETPLSLYDSLFSLFTGVIFGIWGEVEEQPWSFLTSSQRRGNDYRSYPQPDDEDDQNLVPGTV